MKRTRTNELHLPESLIVGVDDRGMSDHAVRAAVDVGPQLGATVELLHAVRVPVLEWMGSDLTKGPAALGQALETAEPAVNEHVHQLIDSFRTSDVGSPSQATGAAFSARTSAVVSFAQASDFHVRVVPGTPTEVLLAAAQEAGSAIIFLGQHEKRGLVDFGSTARAVLSKGAVPVWVQTRPPRPIRRIVAAVDLSDDSLRALSYACLLASRLGATVRAVHFFDVSALFASVTPDPLGFTPAISVLDLREKLTEDFERAMAAFDWRGVDHSAEVRDGKAEEGLLELGSTSDLLVLGTHGRTGLALGVLGGVAHAVLKQSDAPVLAVPFPSRRFRI
jgi:nucleotide-binding universal stress UspA family protein